MPTVVLQSHTSPLPWRWLATCTNSVKGWASSQGYDYRWLGDELFDLLPAKLRHKTKAQPVITADLARLRWLDQVLIEGHQRVVWIDADVLVLDPDSFVLPDTGHGFGREIWVQESAGKIRTYPKLHNAIMQFTAGDPVLPFYRDFAERIVLQHRNGPMAPQIVGPKLVTALHNVVGFNVIEAAGMLPPLVARDLLCGEGPALQAFRKALRVAPTALNLCSSLDADYQALGLDMSAIIACLQHQTLLARPGTSQT